MARHNREPLFTNTIMNNFQRYTAVALLASTSLTAMTGCESPAATGALAGAGAGALTGSLVGGRNSTLLGAGIGAAAGALIGHAIGQSRDDGYYDGRRLPYGRALGRGLVESPYYPNNVIDTRGIPHGEVVEDPSTGGRFIKP
jgi:hypothetical protein